ncbi:MAG: hypothetical protein R3F17_11795 [Planctomycetota bacterium]
MHGRATVEWQVERDGERVHLVAPEAGLVTELPRAGWALAPGQDAGVLLVLGRAKQPSGCPEGLAGFVCPGGPEPVHAPVTAGRGCSSRARSTPACLAPTPPRKAAITPRA